MSEIYTFKGIGWSLFKKDIDKLFTVHIDKISHTVVTYNKYTGLPEGSEEYVDQEECDMYVYGPKTIKEGRIYFGDIYEWSEHFGATLKVDWSIHPNDDSLLHIVVQNEQFCNSPTGMNAYDSITDFKKLEKECKRVHKMLIELGFEDPGYPSIITCSWDD